MKLLLPLGLLVMLQACQSDEKPVSVARSKVAMEKVDTWARIRNSEKEIHTLLQGEWVSTDDSLYTLEFDHDSVFDVFDGEVDEAARFHIAKSCPDADQSENAAKEDLVLVKEGDNFCYSLIFLNETDLQLRYLAKGNMLSFKRAE